MGAEHLFTQNGCKLVHAHDQRCIEMMREFIAIHPELWNEDLGIPEKE